MVAVLTRLLARLGDLVLVFYACGWLVVGAAV